MTILPAADFQYGPFDEIYPPPLVGGMDPETALQALLAAAEAGGQPISTVPTRGASRDGLINLAMLYHHQCQLKVAFCGDSQEADGIALYAALQDGARLSLRPLGQEALHFSTFAPVLQWVGSDRWRVGLPDYGRHMIISGDNATVLEQAWALYTEWSDAERERFEAAAAKILESPASIYHLYWHLCIAQVAGQSGSVNLAPDVIVARLNHTLYRLLTPNGARLFTASTHERAVRIGEALALRFKQGIDYPEPDIMRAQFSGTFAQPPALQGETWTFDNINARWGGNQGKRWAVLGVGAARYALQLEGNLLQVLPVQTTGKVRPVAEIVCPVTQQQWLQEALTDPLKQELILGWAAYRLSEYLHTQTTRRARASK